MPKSKIGVDPSMISLPFDMPTPNQPLALPRARVTGREEAFFGRNRPTPASQVKSKILVNAFLGWASVMLHANPVALWYVDLYCGRGTYTQDGSWATPLQLFDRVAKHPALLDVLKMLFNDSREASVFQLRDALIAHPEYGQMRNPPRFSVGEVDEAMVAELQRRRPRTPTYAFIDPFGYKGLTQRLIREVLREYGCDVMFFFNYHIVKRVLANPNSVMRGHLEALLGVDRTTELREKMSMRLPEQELEQAILAALGESMKAIDGRTVLTFAFRRPTGHASHHLAFVSKHPRGFEVAKDAMAKNSSWQYDGSIPSLEYIEPGFEHTLVRMDSPSIAKLTQLLIERKGGETVTVDQAYESVLFDTPYYKPNVREALVGLVRDHRAVLFSDGQPSNLRGSRFPPKPTVRIPLRIATR